MNNYCYSAKDTSSVLTMMNNYHLKDVGEKVTSNAEFIKTNSNSNVSVSKVVTKLNDQNEFEVGTVITPVSGKNKNKNKYTLIKKLGNGSYAVVYLSINNHTKEKVALKCVNIKYKEKELIMMQLKEVEYLNKLKDCPNIAKFKSCFESNEYKNYLFIELEYVEGLDLFEYLVEEENLVKNSKYNINNKGYFIPEKHRFFEIKPIFNQILKCVESCHDNNIFHRDLKPENFMINKETKQVKLIDFGLATNQKKSKEFKFGSKTYMSPECRKEDYSKKGYYVPKLSDIWSLGIIFLNLLCFRSPWTDPTYTCSEFNDFKIEGTYYLVRELDCSYTVADYLTSHIFCNEKSRDSIYDFQNWIDNLYTTKTGSIPIGNKNSNVNKTTSTNGNQIPKTTVVEDPTKIFITPESSPNTNFNHFNKFINMNNIPHFDWADDDFEIPENKSNDSPASSYISSGDYLNKSEYDNNVSLPGYYNKINKNAKLVNGNENSNEFSIYKLLEKMNLND